MTQPHQSEDATMKPVELPACPECDGAGEFESALHCETCFRCNGTGKDLGVDYAPDRGPLTMPAELTDESARSLFDLERGKAGKGERLARRDDQQAAALDWQALDVIRRAGL